MTVVGAREHPSFLRYRLLTEKPTAIDPLAMRITIAGGPERAGGEFVLYWMQSARRLRSNLALDYAIVQANRRRLPLLAYESIRPDYPEANDRLHTFVLEGVAANRAEAAARGIRYHFYLPRTPEQARGVLRSLSARAALVVTDEFPTGIIRDQTARFVERADLPIHRVDGNGLLPMRAFPKEQYSARFFRDRAHRLLGEMLAMPTEVEPEIDPFRGEVGLPEYDGTAPFQAAGSCKVDHSVERAPLHGGRNEALATLSQFVKQRLSDYDEKKSRHADAASGLSPFLHFGHLGIHEVVRAVLSSSSPVESIDSFLEQAVIRRELSFNLCHFRPDHDTLAVLPAWARETLDRHRGDRRKPEYDYEQLENAATEDEVWNLTQRGLLLRGSMHGYLRMLWGKKIIQWSATPEQAHATMLRLHARYALDGRDPNTHAGVLWCLGKHDRPWAPERPIFGTIRYMSSESTKKKVRLADYARFVAGGEDAADRAS